jgi:transposase InsO family protein
VDFPVQTGMGRRPPDRCGEPDVGRAAKSRGTPNARHRHLRANWIALEAKNVQRSCPATRWAVFLRNHREVIAAMNIFTVPTLTFGVLYCFFVIAHDRRRILHLNATQHPTGAWTSQQLREAFPYDCAPKCLILDRASNFDGEVIDTIKSFSVQPKRTSFRSPRQNGVAERYVRSCRCELLDHVIVLNERHLKRLMID